MRDGAVEADVVAEGEVAFVTPAHRDQPAAGAHIHDDAMVRAVAPDCLDEDPLVCQLDCHVPRSLLSLKTAKMRETAPNMGDIRTILNEILASAREIKCWNCASEGKEIALHPCQTANPLMMRPFPREMPI